MTIDDIRTNIFDQIRKTYRTINPTLSDLLTLDGLTGKEADSLELQLKRIKKQNIGYIILTAIGLVTFIVFTLIGLLKSKDMSPIMGLMGLIIMTLIVSIFRLKMLIKSIENQIFLHRLLDKFDDK